VGGRVPFDGMTREGLSEQMAFELREQAMQISGRRLCRKKEKQVRKP